MVTTAEVRQRLRQEMPVSNKFAYFDHAAVSPIPRGTAEAIQKYAEQSTQEGDVRWLDWSAAASQTRHCGARLIHASETEIALVSNTTQGISIVAEGFPWESGDNIVVPVNEFPSNLLPWRNLARKGVEIRLAPVGVNGELNLEWIENLIDDRTRIVSVSWVGFLSGYRCNLVDLVQKVHAKGSLLFVDAIQGLGAFPISVQELEIDFLAADGHKWMLGPEGAGLLFVREKHLPLLEPVGVGWNSLSAGGFDPTSIQLKSSAARYEGGSSNLVGMIALGKSLELLLELEAHQAKSGFHRAILENVDQLNQLLLAGGLETVIPNDSENRSGIIGIRWPEADREGEGAYLRARKYLLSQNIVLSVRGGRLRAATHAYNNREDHQRLVDAIIEFRSRGS